jgi:hypothetical protein
MASPGNSPLRNLQGASRMAGGVIRGRAQGNIYNFADEENLQDFTFPAETASTGVLHVFLSRDAAKPAMTLKLKVTTQLGPVLEVLAERYSPVKSKCWYLL